jgi:hypothetical protein
MKSKNISEDTAINVWLMNKEWVSQKLVLSDTALIQNVVNNKIALIINVTYIDTGCSAGGWLVSYFYDDEVEVQWAAELWSWRMLE